MMETSKVKNKMNRLYDFDCAAGLGPLLCCSWMCWREGLLDIDSETGYLRYRFSLDEKVEV